MPRTNIVRKPHRRSLNLLQRRYLWTTPLSRRHPPGIGQSYSTYFGEDRAMQRRTFVAGATALAGLTALPWNLTMAAEGGEPVYGRTLRVAFASDIHSGRFTMNRETPPGYETFWVSNNTHNALVTLGPELRNRAGSGQILGDSGQRQGICLSTARQRHVSRRHAVRRRCGEVEF